MNNAPQPPANNPAPKPQRVAPPPSANPNMQPMQNTQQPFRPLPKPARKDDESFTKEFKKLESEKPAYIIDAALKRPAEVVHSLIEDKSTKTTLTLLVILVICLSAIGLIMGSFSGGVQFFQASAKVTLGTLVSAAICLPSLYIMVCLSGGKQSFPEVSKILLLGLTLSGFLFVGFMPVGWLFSQATEQIVFMGVIYLIIWGIGLSFGLRLLKKSFDFLNKKNMGYLQLWMVIFILVLLQMSTTLRPIIGSADTAFTAEKQFFLGHWGECMTE